MQITVLYGRAGSGKTHACMETIKSLVKTGARAVLLVPEQFSYRTEKLLVGAAGAASSETAEVLTFSRLAGRVFLQKSGAAKLPISAAGKNMLVYRALMALRSGLTTYALATEKLGFVDQISALISEFKRYGVTPQQLEELCAQADDPALKGKIGDLAQIYRAYEELFLEDYCDFEDNLYTAAAQLAESGCLDGTHVLIDEFSDFLPQHYKMIEAMCDCAASITVCLCADDALDTQGVFAPAARTFYKLKKLASEMGIGFSTTYFPHNLLHREHPVLHHLEKQYTRYAPAPFAGETKDISIFEALNVYSEIEQAARRIVALCRDEGYRWRDIALCCGDAETYFEPVKMIFSRYGIPCFLSEKTAAAEHPLVLTILSALDILAGGFRYEDVFAYLKAGFANVSAQEADLLENYVLATGATRRAWLDDKPWSYKSDFTPQHAEANLQIDEIRRRVAAPLIKLREGIGSRRTVREACTAVYAFVCDLEMGARVERLVEEFKQQGEFVLANRYSRIWNSILNILDQMVLTAGDKKIGMEQFRNLMETGLLKEQMGIIPQAADAVSVLDVSLARASECRCLFALGTNCGAFAGSAVQEGILTDREREAIAALGLELAPTAREASFDARFLAYKAVTKPSERLFLSYAVAGMDGAALPESDLCRNVRRMFADVEQNDDLQGGGEADIHMLGTGDGALGTLALQMGDAAPGCVRGLWSGIFQWYQEQERYREKIAFLQRAAVYTNAAQQLPERQMAQLYHSGLNTSVSRLERYSQCPFSYFIEYTLKAKERKVLKLGAPDIGSLLHAVLEAFTKRIMQEGKAWREIDGDYCEAAVTAIIDELCEEIFAGSPLMGKAMQYLLLRLKRSLVRCAKLVVLHIAAGRFEPVGSEVRFGSDGQLRAVVVDLTSGKKLKIHGLIDRIDACETEDGTYYRVIDYKSGSKTFSLENIYHKLDLQLVVYLDAAMQQKSGAKPAGMLYFRIQEPMTAAGGPMSEEEAAFAVQESMKLDGLVLGDEGVIADMDRNYRDGSAFLPVKMNKNGSIRINSSVATMQQFRVLSDYVKGTLRQIGDSILHGKIDIAPYKNGEQSPCSYCAYKSVCKFDVSRPGNGYRKCGKVKAAEVWEKFGENRG